MKIFIDINHPAHVHYFRNFISEMKLQGHLFCITARNKEVSQVLIEKYQIAYIDRGKGSKNILGKIFYMIYDDLKLIYCSLRFRPDLFFSFGSMYASHASFILRKPHIICDDTEHSRFQQFLTNPFSSLIFTPKCFRRDFGKNVSIPKNPTG